MRKQTNYFLVLAILFVLSIPSVFSQDSCKVLKPEISGKYQGNCKKGLAQGNGIAEGTDKYEGHFKNGLPDGKGKYTWANGNTYEGDWKTGRKNGNGKSTYKKNGKDSIVYGLWEDDKFIKIAFPVPYKIFIVRDIDNYTVSKVGDGKDNNKITLKLKRCGADNTKLTDFNFVVDNGLYEQLGNNYIYYNVVFPIAIKITYTTPNKFNTIMLNPVLEITINEPGDWDITLTN
jgi:hypothetical protein